MHDWYYKFVNLPHVPEDLITESYKSIQNWDTDKNFWWWPKSAQEVDTVNGEQKNSVGFIQFNLSQHITQWFTDNIVTSGYNNIKIVSNTDGDHKGAHTDKTRDYVLMYLLSTGGYDSQTVWFIEKDKPLIRERKERCHDYNLLTELERVRIPLRQWVIINSRIMHGIDKIVSTRESFHIGLEHPFELKGNFIN